MGERIAERRVPKILILNGTHDRETSRSWEHDGPMTAADIVRAVADTLNRRHSRFGAHLDWPPSAYVTALLVPDCGGILFDRPALELLDIE